MSCTTDESIPGERGMGIRRIPGISTYIVEEEKHLRVGRSTYVTKLMSDLCPAARVYVRWRNESLQCVN
jgi:hypothetical protein